MRILTILVSIIILNCNSAFRKYDSIGSDDFIGNYNGQTTLLTDTPHKIFAIGYKDSAIITVRTYGVKSSHFEYVFYKDTLYKHNHNNMDIKIKVWQSETDSTKAYSDYLQNIKYPENHSEELYLLKGKNSEIYKIKNKWHIDFFSSFNAENKQSVELIRIE